MARFDLNPTLRSYLGCRFEELTSTSLERLIGVTESEFLEVKSEMYAPGDTGNREMALDVASLGNAGGGLLLIGFEEIDDVLTSLRPIARDGVTIGRIEQVINSSIFPHLKFESRWIDFDNETAVLALLIPPSRTAPHLVKRNESYRATVRRGSRRVPMTEAEIAERYKHRFISSTEQKNHLLELQDEMSARTGHVNNAVLVMSAIPEYLGDLEINYQSVKTTSEQFLDFARRCPSLFRSTHGSAHFSIGLRRLILADYRFQEEFVFRYFYVEAHRDGTISAALPLGNYGEPNPRSTATSSFVHMQDEDVSLTVLECMLIFKFFLELTGASGDMSVAMRLVAPLVDEKQADLRFVAPDRSGLGAFGDFHQNSRPNNGFGDILSEFTAEDLSDNGSGAVRIAHSLSRDLLSAFGISGPAQLSPDGALRKAGFSSVHQGSMAAWADQLGVPWV